MSAIILPVFDLFANEYSTLQIEYRNTLLGYLFPLTEFAVGDVSGFIRDEDLEGAAAALDKGFDGYQLIGASGSRKHGSCLFARGGNHYMKQFFNHSNSHSVNYGSNLTTECRHMFELAMKVLIVNDCDFSTGDCHGKCSSAFARHAIGSLTDDPLATPFQFRACDPEALWVAKGTIAYLPELDNSEYALVLPVSAFKGDKNADGYVVSPGIYDISRLVFGIVHLAEKRLVNMSYSVTQFFPWSAVEADVLPGTRTQFAQLNELMGNSRQLAEYLLSHQEDESDDEAQEYVPAMLQILKADKFGQLEHHPWFVDRVQKMFRKRILKLATAGGVRFHSYMCQPDESIPYGQVCIPDLIRDEQSRLEAEGYINPNGEHDVIAFPYPCRWKHDINVVRNIQHERWMGYTGVFVASAATLLDLWSRDTDGK